LWNSTKGGEDRAAHGEGFLDRLADDLAGKQLKGFSRDMLERMRHFYLTYPAAYRPDFRISDAEIRAKSSSVRVTGGNAYLKSPCEVLG
jgi:hypothetical protein